jgi:hypothetical protein
MKSTALAFHMNNFRDITSNLNSFLMPLNLKSSPKEVGTMVVSFMIWQLIRGDILRRATRESWSVKNGIIRIPTAATVFSDYNSTTSVTLLGYVIDNGGSELNTSGIAWASFYNPTVDDNLATRETGTAEDFTVTLHGLTEGDTYYARTYATNTAGIAYGNCIRFIASAPSGMASISAFNRDLIMYPNPASALTTFIFDLESPGNLMLTIMNMKGQVVLSKDYGLLPQGSNKINADFSGLPVGTYMCRLTCGAKNITQKLVISR